MSKILLLAFALLTTYPPLHASEETKINLSDKKEDTIDTSVAKLTRQAAVRNLIVTKINHISAFCDICGEPATNFWVDSEAGCKWSRCSKHNKL